MAIRRVSVLDAAEIVPEEKDEPRPLTHHLDELRRRLLWSLATVAVTGVFCYFYTDAFLRHLAGVTGPMVFLRPGEAFLVKVKMALTLGALAAAPFLLYHVWRYIGVAMTVSERRVVLGALPFSYLLFAAGAALGWFVVAPAGLQFLVGFGSSYIQPFISVEACFDFCLGLVLGMGLLFQLPVVLSALAYWGLLDADALPRYRRHAAVAILLIGGLITPGPDVISQLLLAVPTYLLFELSIWLARILQPTHG